MGGYFSGFSAPGGTVSYTAAYTVKQTVDDGLITGDADQDSETKTDYISIVAVGDTDGDGKIEADDLTLAEMIVVGTGVSTGFEDADDSGAVNILDITRTEILSALYASWV